MTETVLGPELINTLLRETAAKLRLCGDVFLDALPYLAVECDILATNMERIVVAHYEDNRRAKEA